MAVSVPEHEATSERPRAAREASGRSTVPGRAPLRPSARGGPDEPRGAAERSRPSATAAADDDPRWSTVALFAAIAVVLALGALRGGWALDDRELLFGNPVTSGALPWAAAFERDYFAFLGGAGQWRPLASLSLRLDRSLFGEEVAGYHLVNAALQLAVVACAFGALRSLGLRRRVLHFGLVAFAIHPLLTDAVVWIAGRTSMLSALGPLLGGWAALELARRGRGPLACALPASLGLLAGLLAKEDAVVFGVALPLAIGAAAARVHARDTIDGGESLGAAARADGGAWRWAAATALGCGAVVALVLGARFLALGEALPRAASPALGEAALGERLVVGGSALFEALRLALLPIDYPPQYRVDFLLERAAPLAAPVASACGWLLALLPLAFFALRPMRSSVAATSAMLAVLAFLPVTQLVPAGEVFAPRFLYLPLLFAIPFVGAAGARLFAGRALPVATALLTLGFGALFVQRAEIYRDIKAWRVEMLRHHPDDAPSWNALGLWHEEAGREDAAEAALRRAIEADPSYSRSWSNLGRMQLERGDLTAAEETLTAAVRAGPRNAIARVNLAAVVSKRGRTVDAAEHYRAALRLAPELAPAWRGLGLALRRLGKETEARSALERALQLDPGDRAARALLDATPSEESTPDEPGETERD